MIEIAASICFIVSIVFLALYAVIMDLRNEVAANIWTGVLSIAILSLAGIILENDRKSSSEIVAVVAYSLGAFVSSWRIYLVIKFSMKNLRISESDDKDDDTTSS